MGDVIVVRLVEDGGVVGAVAIVQVIVNGCAGDGDGLGPGWEIDGDLLCVEGDMVRGVMPRVGSSRSSWVTRYLSRRSWSRACRLLVVGVLRVTVKDTDWPSFTQAWSPETDTEGLTPSSS